VAELCELPPRAAIFPVADAQLARLYTLRSGGKRFKKSHTWVIGDGEHEPALGSDRAMVP
jgi:hypothetical protein